MRHRVFRTAVLMLLIVALSACSPKFKLQALDTATVPAEILANPPTASGATNYVWRAFHKEGDWYLAAFTFDLNTPLQSGAVVGPCYGISFYTLDEAGEFHGGGGARSALPAYAFVCGGGTSSGGVTEAKPTGYSISAYGTAFHPQAAKVVGTTSVGRNIECRVVNGFWGLLVRDADGSRGEWWTSVNVVATDGRVLFSCWDGERWRQGN